MKTGIELIAEERAAQVSREGWTPTHDDDHDNGSLALAAAAYAFQSAGEGKSMPRTEHGFTPLDLWPWDASYWKPKDSMRDLVRAGALIVAEIDRRQRAAEVDRVCAPKVEFKK